MAPEYHIEYEVRNSRENSTHNISRDVVTEPGELITDLLEDYEEAFRMEHPGSRIVRKDLRFIK